MRHAGRSSRGLIGEGYRGHLEGSGMRIVLGAATVAFATAWGVTSVSAADAAISSRVYLAFQAGITQEKKGI